MRYDDASQTGSIGNSEPVARPDVDEIPAGTFSASGNAITGAGTTTGAAGADAVGNGAAIVAVQGAGGPTTGGASGFQATGQYGILNMDAQGDFNYVRNPGTPEGVQDVFNYTLADASGASSSTTLSIGIGPTNAAASAAAAQQGVVNLPAGVEMSDIHVRGNDLVIDLPNGTQMIIPGGAVFVPDLTIGDTIVPPSNLAALLIGEEPQPAAGATQSSGNNFAEPVPPLDPGVPLGDLIPPTELTYTPPDFHEVNQFEDHEPEITIQPDGQPAAVSAVDSVDEKGLPTRNGGEPEGSGEEAAAGANGDPSEATAGVIHINSPDGIDGVSINGVTVTGVVGQVIAGDFGTLVITGFLPNGDIQYSYTLTDNTSGDNTHDDFSVTITDNDGDTATATLRIDIIDDVPTARNDTDSVTVENPSTTGNVMTGADTTSGTTGRDTVGADDASLTTVSGAHGSDSTFDSDGNLVVQGQYGTLTIDAEGNYTYELTGQLPANVSTDVFTYTLTDGDGDTDTATLTITVPANSIPEILSADPTLVDEDGLPGANVDGDPLRPGETDSTESATDTGQIVVDYKNDIPANLMAAITLVDDPALDGQLTTPDGTPIVFALEGGDLVGRPEGGGDPVIIISIDSATPGSGGQVSYTYSVELLGPVAQPDPGSEDSVILQNVGVQITDSNGDHASATVDVTIVDDLPVAIVPPPDPEHPNDPPPPLVSGAVDEDDLDSGNNDVADGDDLPINSSTTVTGGVGSLDALFSAGADSPMKDFGLINDDSGLPALQSGGHDVLYDINTATGVLTAYADLDDNGIIDDGDASKVFTLTVNSDGSWEFDLQGALDHPDTTTEDNLSLDFSSIITATDQDGDPATAAPGAFVINVDDDSPVHGEINTELPAVVVDESPIGQDPGGDNDPAGVRSATVDFSGNFGTPSFGADGEGSVHYALSLNGSALGSGLYALDASDTDAGDGDGIGQGDEIMLVDNGDGTISGVIGSDVYFTISVDPDTGEVTFEQFINVWHADPTNNDDTSFLDAADGTITLVQTITDGDGDSDTASLDLSNNVFQIEDDGPTGSNPDASDLPILVVDESPIGQDEGGDNDPAGVRTATADFSGAFGGSGAVGTDGLGSVTYTLSLHGSALGSGLYALDASDTDAGDGDGIGQGDEIMLVDNGDGTISGVVGSDVYFTISVDADGNVTFEQFLNVWHADTGSDDDTSSLVAQAGTITLDQVITDADGDTASASVDLSDGIFNIEDDGPSAGVNEQFDTPTLVVDESPLGQDPGGDNDPAGVRTATADFSGAFLTPDFGTDGEGSVQYALSLNGSALGSGLYALDASDTDAGDGDGIGQGDEIMLVDNGDGTISGVIGSDVYFTISVDADTGEVKFEQFLNVWHSDPTNNDDTSSLDAADGTITLVQTVTDADGDSESASVDLSNNVFQIEDDGPTTDNPDTSELPTLVVDESPIGLDEGGDNDPAGVRTATADFSGAFGANDVGTDGLGSVAYVLSLHGSALGSGLYALDNTDTDAGDGDGYGQGDEIMLVDNGDGTISGVVGSDVYFTISVDADGKVTFEQFLNVWHADTTNDDDTSSLVAASGTITLDQVVTDADGDTATASIDLSDGIFNIEDDGPFALNPDSIETTDEAQSTISASLDLPDNDVTDNFGTDGPGTITFANISDGDDSGFKSGGDAITYWLSDDGQTLEGRTNSTDGTDGTLIFTVHIDQANSEYDYTQFETIDNGSGITFSDLSGGVAGNPPFKLITEPGESLELLASPINGSSINSDTDDMGVDSQFIDTTAGADKGVRLDFGDFTYVPNGGGTADDQFEMESHSTVNGFKFTIDQVSNGTTADVHLVAYDANEDGGLAENTPNPAGDTIVSITSVKIYDDLGNVVGTYTADGSIGSSGATIDFITTDPSHVTVTIDNLPAGYSIETYTASGYDRIEITNPGNDASSDTDGKFSISNFQITTTNTGDPVNLNYDLQITDADGDSEVISNAINITLDPVGAQALSALSFQSSATLSKTLDTSSLFSSNDNHGHNDLRYALHGNNNAALLGAIAAAGLSSAQQLSAHGFESHVSDHHFEGLSRLAGSIESFQLSGRHDGGTGDGDKLAATSTVQHDSVVSKGPVTHDEVQSKLSNDQPHHDAPGALPQGTDAPAQPEGGQATAAAAVAMASAQQLAGKGAGDGQHDEVVAKVLADALHGGGSDHGTPNIESLINELPGAGGGHALSILASQGDAAVSMGHMSGFAGFGMGQNVFSEHAMMLHQDAAPAHG